MCRINWSSVGFWVIALLLVVAIITGCFVLFDKLGCRGIVNDADESVSDVGVVDIMSKVKQYIDPNTGVCYLLITYSGGVGISPRYNADGSLMVRNITSS